MFRYGSDSAVYRSGKLKVELEYSDTFATYFFSLHRDGRGKVWSGDIPGHFHARPTSDEAFAEAARRVIDQAMERVSGLSSEDCERGGGKYGNDIVVRKSRIEALR